MNTIINTALDWIGSNLEALLLWLGRIAFFYALWRAWQHDDVLLAISAVLIAWGALAANDIEPVKPARAPHPRDNYSGEDAP